LRNTRKVLAKVRSREAGPKSSGVKGVMWIAPSSIAWRMACLPSTDTGWGERGGTGLTMGQVLTGP